MRRAGRLLLPLLFAGCFRAPVPMRKLDYAVNPPARCLVLLLPGAGSTAEDFEREGFLRKLQASGLSLDVVAANATLGYYFSNSLVSRLYTDVLEPTQKAKQYEKTWLIGMSMGGFGSLFFTQHHPEAIDGVFALAPWLGDEKLGREIREAGGLRRWQAPQRETPTDDNYQRQLWRWLQETTASGAARPVIYTGWGKDDRLGQMDALLAETLPEQQVMLTEGGHDWPPWNMLLERFLKEGPLAKDCSKQAAFEQR